MLIKDMKKWSEAKEWLVTYVDYKIYQKSKNDFFNNPKVSDSRKLDSFTSSVIAMFDTKAEAEAYANPLLFQKRVKKLADDGVIPFIYDILNEVVDSILWNYDQYDSYNDETDNQYRIKLSLYKLKNINNTIKGEPIIHDDKIITEFDKFYNLTLKSVPSLSDLETQIKELCLGCGLLAADDKKSFGHILFDLYSYAGYIIKPIFKKGGK